MVTSSGEARHTSRGLGRAPGSCLGDKRHLELGHKKLKVTFKGQGKGRRSRHGCVRPRRTGLFRKHYLFTVMNLSVSSVTCSLIYSLNHYLMNTFLLVLEMIYSHSFVKFYFSISVDMQC